MLLPSGNPFKCRQEVLYFQPMIPSKRFDILPPDWGMISRSKCVQIFLSTSISTRGISARYALEFSFARCHDEAASVILILLHCCPTGNTSRTGEPTSPAAKSAELNDGEILAFGIKGENEGLLRIARPGWDGRRCWSKRFNNRFICVGVDISIYA